VAIVVAAFVGFSPGRFSITFQLVGVSLAHYPAGFSASQRRFTSLVGERARTARAVTGLPGDLLRLRYGNLRSLLPVAGTPE